MKEWWKILETFDRDGKIPRRAKKHIMGKKLNKRNLKMLLSSAEVTTHKYPESSTITPYSFCPDCGCREVSSVNHHVGYPEVWYEEFCLRCGAFVGGADNSPYVHVLEDLRGV